jgi:DegV family protein with EDD domain
MASKRIEIITDSTCDIPAALIEQYSIVVQPHVIIWGEHQYRDRVDLQPVEFYRRLTIEPVMPTTSQATVPDFAAAYERARERGADAVVAILVSSGLSGAYLSASSAAREARLPVSVFDSRGATMSLGWQVIAAARVREAGGDVADLLAAADRVRQRAQLYIGLDTLEFLYRGGRIGNARRLVGAMLNIKPLIYVEHATGIVEAGGMALTRRKSLDMLYSKFFSLMDVNRPLHVAVMHGDAEQDAAEMFDRVHREYPQAEVLTNITGPALGINTGPKAIALCGYCE